MNYCIDRLYQEIPAILRPLFNKEALESMIQKAFDSIEDYATMSVIKATEEVDKKLEELEERFDK